MKIEKKLWITLFAFGIFAICFSGWIFRQSTAREKLFWDNTIRCETKELKEGEIYDDSRWGVMIQNELSVQLNRIIQVTRWLVVKLLGLVPYGVILFVLILIMRCLFKGRKRKP
mgnify:CR=1 FL=1